MTAGRRRRHWGARPADMEHQPRQYKPRRNRTRTFDFEAERSRAKRYPCPPSPKGCGAPVGTTCRNKVTGDELVNLPACLARTAAADAAPTDQPDELDQAAHTATTEETPTT